MAHSHCLLRVADVVILQFTPRQQQQDRKPVFFSEQTLDRPPGWWV